MLMKKVFRILAGLLLLLLLVYVLYPTNIISREQAIRLYKTPGSKFMDWQGEKIHYTDEGSGAPILMVHGFGGSLHNFDDVSSILGKHYRVIRVDLPGFGLSALPIPSQPGADYIAHYRDFFNSFLSHLQLDSVYLVGNSLGGWMSWEMAVERPDVVRKIVLIAPAGYEMEEISARVARILRIPGIGLLYAKGQPMFMSRRNAEKVFAVDSKISDHLVNTNNRMSNTGDNLETMIRLGRAGVVADTARIARIQCPALVLWGKQDEIIPYQHAAKFGRDIKAGTVITYDPCGHCPQMELPEKVSRDIMQFLGRSSF